MNLFMMINVCVMLRDAAQCCVMYVERMMACVGYVVRVVKEDGHHADKLTDWTEEETQIPNGNTHLWEESWDDDDTNDDFAVQLR